MLEVNIDARRIRGCVLTHLCVLFPFTTSFHISEVSASQQKTHLAIAFEVPGGWLNEKDAMTLTVLQVKIFFIQ